MVNCIFPCQFKCYPFFDCTFLSLLFSFSAISVLRSRIPAVANHMKGVDDQLERGNDASGTSSFSCCNRLSTYDSTSSNLSDGGGKKGVEKLTHDQILDGKTLMCGNFEKNTLG